MLADHRGCHPSGSRRRACARPDPAHRRKSADRRWAWCWPRPRRFGSGGPLLAKQTGLNRRSIQGLARAMPARLFGVVVVAHPRAVHRVRDCSSVSSGASSHAARPRRTPKLLKDVVRAIVADPGAVRRRCRRRSTSRSRACSPPRACSPSSSASPCSRRLADLFSGIALNHRAALPRRPLAPASTTRFDRARSSRSTGAPRACAPPTPTRSCCPIRSSPPPRSSITTMPAPSYRTASLQVPLDARIPPGVAKEALVGRRPQIDARAAWIRRRLVETKELRDSPACSTKSRYWIDSYEDDTQRARRGRDLDLVRARRGRHFPRASRLRGRFEPMAERVLEHVDLFREIDAGHARARGRRGASARSFHAGDEVDACGRHRPLAVRGRARRVRGEPRAPTARASTRGAPGHWRFLRRNVAADRQNRAARSVTALVRHDRHWRFRQGGASARSCRAHPESRQAAWGRSCSTASR
jgi:hypothetical protein